jgi:hypothetical protein
MLVLVGTLRAATTLPGGTNKKTGELIKPRDVLQIETLDGRGLVAMNTITVPSLDTYKQLIQPNRHAGSSLFWGFPNTLKPRGIYDQKTGHFYRPDR